MLKENNWLFILGIFGLLLLIFCPFLINFDQGEGYQTLDFIFSYGLFYEFYWHTTGVRYVTIPLNTFNNISYFLISPVFNFIGMTLIILAGIFLSRDRRGAIYKFTILTIIGSSLGLLATFLFLPFGINVLRNQYFFLEANSTQFNWFFLGIYLLFALYASLLFWGIFRLVKHRLSPMIVRDSELRLDSLKLARQSIVELRKEYKTIPIQMLQQILNLDSEAELETLRDLLPEELQYSIVGKDIVFLKETVSKIIDPTTLVTATRKDECFYCKATINLEAEKCPNCNKAVLDCAICRLPIKADQEVGRCPKCEYLFHLKHLKTWVELKEKCPICLQELLPEEIFKYNPS